MSSDSALPPSPDRTRSPAEPARADPKAARSLRRAGGRLWTVSKHAAAIAVLSILLVALGSALFVGVECFSTRSIPKSTSPSILRVTADIDNYSRDASSTYLTVPEWYIVYSTEEYASFIGQNPPSGFPYFGSVRQYWSYYANVCQATKGVYPFNPGTHFMLVVIGVSFSVENTIKGLYENTIGRATEWIGRDTEEDAFASRTAREYGTFMHTVPWYEFPFARKLAGLWRDTPFRGRHPIRKWERRFALTVEYGVKTAYAWMIGWGTHGVYAPEDLAIHAWIETADDRVFADSRIHRMKEVAPRSYIVTIPRYEAFTDASLSLVGTGARVLDIAGNDEILLTVIAARDWKYDWAAGVTVFSESILTNPDLHRVGLRAPVKSLLAILRDLQARGVKVEHLYDY